MVWGVFWGQRAVPDGAQSTAYPPPIGDPGNEPAAPFYHPPPTNRRPTPDFVVPGTPGTHGAGAGRGLPFGYGTAPHTHVHPTLTPPWAPGYPGETEEGVGETKTPSCRGHPVPMGQGRGAATPPRRSSLTPIRRSPSFSSCRGHPVRMGQGRGAATPPRRSSLTPIRRPPQPCHPEPFHCHPERSRGIQPVQLAITSSSPKP